MPIKDDGYDIIIITSDILFYGIILSHLKIGKCLTIDEYRSTVSIYSTLVEYGGFAAAAATNN